MNKIVEIKYKYKDAIISKCNTCYHWNNKQAQLEYSKFYGICTCHKWKFTTTNDSDCLLLDRDNITKMYMGVSRFENQKNEIPIGDVDRSRYCFVTAEKFGCIHHKNK